MPMNSPLYDYIIEEPGEPREEVRKAMPKVSEYREKFKRKELTIDDIRPFKKSNPIDREPQSTDDALLMGPGLEEDWD